MAISASITTALASLQAQVTAARPLASASFPTVRAIQLNAINLVADVQSALVVASTLDTWVAPPDAASIVTGFNAVVTAAQDQNTLSLMRGVVGRASTNLNELS